MDDEHLLILGAADGSELALSDASRSRPSCRAPTTSASASPTRQKCTRRGSGSAPPA
jgi:hypothetical protein